MEDKTPKTISITLTQDDWDLLFNFINKRLGANELNDLRSSMEEQYQNKQ